MKIINLTKLNLIKHNLIKIALDIKDKIHGLTNYTIKGNSVVVDEVVKGVGDEFAFNQLVHSFADAVPESIGASLSVNGNTAIFTPTQRYGRIRTHMIGLTNGHKYLLCGGLNYPNSWMQAYTTSGFYFKSINGTFNGFYDSIVTYNKDTQDVRLIFQDNSESDWQSISLDNLQLFDLTAMGLDSVTNLAEFKAYLVSRGLMQSVDDEIPYFDYDAGSVKTSMPIVALNGYGVLDLGSLDWRRGTYAFYADTPIKKTNFTQKRYKRVADNKIGYQMQDGEMSWQEASGQLYIIDSSYADAATFKASLQGVMLYYELATATETSVTRYLLLISSPLHKVGDAADALVCTNGTGSIVRKFAKIVFDGTEDWWSNGFYNSPEISGMKVVDQNVASPIICNHYPVQPAKYGSAYPSVDDDTIRSKGAYPVVIVKDTTYASVDAWKAHLAELYAAGNPLVVVYELATSTTESVELPAITEWEDGYILTTDTEVAPSEVVTE